MPELSGFDVICYYTRLLCWQQNLLPQIHRCLKIQVFVFPFIPWHNNNIHDNAPCQVPRALAARMGKEDGLQKPKQTNQMLDMIPVRETQ